jgi:glycogen synthase
MGGPHAAWQVPLIGWIGRLDYQKGPDVALDAVPGLAARACQVSLLGLLCQHDNQHAVLPY